MNKYRKILLFFLMLFLCTPTFSSELCPSNPNKRKNEYLRSDLVFLGKAADFDKAHNSFQFEILDVYKGFHPLNQINIKFLYNNGENAVRELGQVRGYWIIYAQRRGLNSATVEVCGASRSMQRHVINKIMAPPPEFFVSKKDSLEYYNLKKKLIIERQKEWIKEVL